jgi:hypothetical protein
MQFALRNLYNFKPCNLFYIAGVCTLHVSTNTGHLLMRLKLLVRLLCSCPQVQFLGSMPSSMRRCAPL